MARETRLMASAELLASGGVATECVAVNGVSRQTTPVKTGAGSFYHVIQAAGALRYIRELGRPGWAWDYACRTSFWLYPTAKPQIGSPLTLLFSDNQEVISWRQAASGDTYIDITDGGYVTIYASSAANPLTLNAWNEFCCERDKVTKAVKVFIGGSEIVSYTFGSMVTLQWYDVIEGAQGKTQNPNTTVYTDDIYIATYIAGTDVAPPASGIMAVRIAMPTSDSAVAWSRSAGASNYALVDEKPGDDTDYVYASGASQLDDLYGHESCATIGVPGGDYIWAATPATRARYTVDLYQLRGLLKRTTTVEVPCLTLATAFGGATIAYRDTDTEGQPWTQTNLDNTLMGVRLRSGGGPSGRLEMSSTGLLIASCATDYTPPAPPAAGAARPSGTLMGLSPGIV